jgi:hypothetical protein
MSLYRRLLLLVLPALLLFVGVAPAAAAPAADHQIVTGSASFTIPAGQCASLPAGVSVTGEGESMSVINTSSMPNGSIVTNTNTVTKGVATDSNGGTHTFVYQNFSADTLWPSGEHSIHMMDTFVLTGPGPQFSVGFNWSWTYTDPAVDFWPPQHNLVKTSTRNDPFTCDPL